MTVAIQILCWIALALCALGATAVFSVGRFYHPDSEGPAVFAAVSAPLLILVLLVLVHRVRRGPFHNLLAVFDGGLGLLLAGIGAFHIVTDPGDLILYVWPFLLGLGLIYLAFESNLGERQQ